MTDIQTNKPSEDTTQKVDHPQIDKSLECAICNDLLFKPVTINCGHSFCKECLISAFKLQPVCPLCRCPCFLKETYMKENVILKEMIMSKHHDLYNQRENTLKARIDPSLRNQAINTGQANSTNPISAPIVQERVIENILAFPMIGRSNSEVFFPLCKNKTKISFHGSPELIDYICQDKQFVLLDSNLHRKLPYVSVVAQYKKLTQESKHGVLKVEFEVVDRILVEEIKDFTCLDTKEQQQELGLHGPVRLLSVRGKTEEDELQLPSLDRVESLIKSIYEFIAMKLDTMSHHSQFAYLKVFEKFFNNPMFMDQNFNDVKKIALFSMNVAGSLKATHEERVRMFETKNIMERLILCDAIIKRIHDFNDPTMVFDIESPTQKLNNVWSSIALILGIIVFAYLARNREM